MYANEKSMCRNSQWEKIFHENFFAIDVHWRNWRKIFSWRNFFRIWYISNSWLLGTACCSPHVQCYLWWSNCCSCQLLSLMSMFANSALLGGGVRVRVWIREQRKIKRRSKALLCLWWQTWTSLIIMYVEFELVHDLVTYLFYGCALDIAVL